MEDKTWKDKQIKSVPRRTLANSQGFKFIHNSDNQLTFLCGRILDRQRNEFLIGWQNGPLRLRLLPLHLPVELPPLRPRSELLHRDLLEIETFFQIVSEILNI